MIRKFVTLALRNLLRYRTRNLLTAISIALGSVAIILGLAFSDGIIRQTIIGFTGTLIEDVMVFPDKGPILERYKEIEKAIYGVKGIDYVTKKVQSQGAIFSATSSVNAIIMGMEPEGIRRKTNLEMRKGRYLQADDSLSLILSEKLAARLKVEVGDRIAVVVNMPQGGTNAKDFRIEGIFNVKTGLQFVDHLIYISLWDTQDLMGLTDNQVYSLGVYLKDVEAVDLFEKKIGAGLIKADLPGQVRSWKKVMKGLLQQYYFIKTIVLIFTVVLLLIVCVGVANAMFLSVSERTREIGTMMALGAKRKTIISLFMLEGAILSLFSSFCGSLLGKTLAVLLAELKIEAISKSAVWLFGGKHLYPYLTYPTILFAFGFVVVMSLMGMFYPIIKASKMDPVAALGYV